MPMNDSGQISLGGSTLGESISIQVKQTTTTATSMNDTNVRELAGVPSGAISFGNTRGKAYNAAWGWGSNAFGWLGQNSAINRSSAVQIGSSNQHWSSTIGGVSGFPNTNSYFLSIINGGLYAAGANFYSGGKGPAAAQGNLGTNDAINRSQLVQVGALTNWKNVVSTREAGRNLAVKTDGTLWSWGNGGASAFNNNSWSSPVQLGSATFYQKGLNCYPYFILKTNGEVEAFGDNFSGEVGNNTTNTLPFASRATLAGPWRTISNVGTAASWGIRTNGTLWLWGSLGYVAGSFGTYRSSPVQVGALTNWLSIATNTFMALFVKSDGTLWSVGDNTYGGLGTSNIINRSSPVQVGALTTWGFPIQARPTMASCVRTDGTLWTWGTTDIGDGWGDGTMLPAYRSSPVQVGGATNWSYTGEIASPTPASNPVHRKT
jgi:alpha-tubulin suppressor-like RCC1 family protein